MARQANEDLSKLPAWARKRIEGAEKHVENLKAHIVEISEQHPMSNVAVEGHHIYPDVTLPAYSEIVFYLGDNRDRWKDTVSIRISRAKPGSIEIRGGDKNLVIQPQSYNALGVSLSHD